MDVSLDVVGVIGTRPDQGLKHLKQGFWNCLSLGKVQSTSMAALPIGVEGLQATSVEWNSLGFGQGLHVTKS